MKKLSVEFKGTRDGITIYCLDGWDFDQILSDLAFKLKERSSFFAESEVNVDVGARRLSEQEIQLLKKIIAENSKLKLKAIYNDENRPTVQFPQPLSREEDTKLAGYKEDRSLVIKRTLRSGQRIHFPGTVVVLGEVNPGAEIVAEGDIFVFGSLRGIAHAGAAGDRNAVVVAQRLAPTQLRIAGLITRAPDEEIPLPDQPEYAFISNDSIVIASLSSRS